MDIREIIRQRRSVFPAQFSGEKIPDNTLIELLDLANWAPNHLHTEPWRFHIYADSAIERLMLGMAELYRKLTPSEKFSEAKYEKYILRPPKLSHAILISVAYDEAGRLPKIEESNAVACAVENFWLAISATPDIRGYWSTGNLVYTREFHELAGLPHSETCLGIFYIGKLKSDAVKPMSKRGDILEKITWIRS